MWRLEVLLFFVLFSATFGILLPRLCSHWRYSYYYDARETASTEKYLHDISTAHDQNGLNLNQTASVIRDRSWLLVTIVTVERPNLYLSQVVNKLHELTVIQNLSVQVMICNVDSGEHNEALKLSIKYSNIHLVDRYLGQRRHRHGDMKRHSIFDKEKDDYVFCLNVSRTMFSSDYILMLEDDALPLDDLFPVTTHLLKNRLRKQTDFFYIKLYHPERLQGFLQPEPWRIAEWIALSVSLGSILVLPCSAFFRRNRRRKSTTYMRWRLFFFWTFYFMCLTEAMGRSHLLELRRLSPHLYNVLAATECCTPAMLFSANSAGRVIDYLSSIECKPGFAKDTALYYHIRNNSFKSYVVEPNLVQHIGVHSSLRNS